MGMYIDNLICDSVKFEKNKYQQLDKCLHQRIHKAEKITTPAEPFLAKMKVIMKGGVWKNTEDEILKAAVMKYGKNQWARISSLLVRKTPKQCKARWYEWLDPSIRKTEWSKEEEEKLLHLAKIMPTQWRTIAPLVGRTPAQCLEHYEKLLDVAQGIEEPAENDPRRLRQGEIDPEPETKPARPDPIDMDEDEKEMLSEARARLANTQGKKAKRKAREKQLEEARRLATIQKRREMKAAGIFVRTRYMRKRDVDYNAEVPFKREAPAGFFDTTEEKDKQKDPLFKRVPNLAKAIHGENRELVEKEKRKADIIKQRERKAQGKPLGMDKFLADNEDEQIAKRTKLMLPQPQITDKELDQIVKIGLQGENARSIVDEEATPSRALLSDYNSTVLQSTPLRTPRAPYVTDRLKIEAQNLLALTKTETPLRGGENSQLVGDQNFDGVTPKRMIVQTPNPLLNQLTPRHSPKSTPMAATPYRDSLNINSASEEKLRKEKLLEAFKSLPAPKDDFEIVLPEAEDEAETDVIDIDIDASDIQEQKKLQDEKIRALMESEKSLPLKKAQGLPRPYVFNNSDYEMDFTYVKLASDLKQADELIRFEMLKLMKHDALNHSNEGNVPIGIHDSAELDRFSPEELLSAKELIEKEMVTQAATKYFENPINLEYMFVPSSRSYVEKSSLTKLEKIEALSHEFHKNAKILKKEAQEAAELEKEVASTVRAYQAAQHVKKKITNLWEDIEKTYYELDLFGKAEDIENRTCINRVDLMNELLNDLNIQENGLQLEYADLYSARQQINGK